MAYTFPIPTTYPLDFPTTIKPSRVGYGQRNEVGVVPSAFSHASQAHDWLGRKWEIGLTFRPPKRDADGSAFEAFFGRMQGRSKTCLWGPDSAFTPKGTAAGTPLVQYRNNLLVHADDIEEAEWTQTGTGSVTSNRSDPAGGTTGQSPDDTDTDAGEANWKQTIAIDADSESYSASLYLLEGDAAAPTLRLALQGGGDQFLATTLTWATETASGAGVLEDVGGGFFRLSISGTNNGGNTSATWQLFPAGITGTEIGNLRLYLPTLVRAANPENGVTSGAVAVAALAPSAGDTVFFSDGWTPGDQVLNKGDFFQLGTESTARLYQITRDITADAFGNARLEFWPGLRDVPADNAAIITSDPRGVFRIMDDPVQFDWLQAQLNGFAVNLGEVF